MHLSNAHHSPEGESTPDSHDFLRRSSEAHLREIVRTNVEGIDYYCADEVHVQCGAQEADGTLSYKIFALSEGESLTGIRFVPLAVELPPQGKSVWETAARFGYETEEEKGRFLIALDEDEPRAAITMNGFEGPSAEIKSEGAERAPRPPHGGTKSAFSPIRSARRTSPCRMTSGRQPTP